MILVVIVHTVVGLILLAEQFILMQNGLIVAMMIRQNQPVWVTANVFGHTVTQSVKILPVIHLLTVVSLPVQ